MSGIGEFLHWPCLAVSVMQQSNVCMSVRLSACPVFLSNMNRSLGAHPTWLTRRQHATHISVGILRGRAYYFALLVTRKKSGDGVLNPPVLKWRRMCEQIISNPAHRWRGVCVAAGNSS